MLIKYYNNSRSQLYHIAFSLFKPFVYAVGASARALLSSKTLFIIIVRFNIFVMMMILCLHLFNLKIILFGGDFFSLNNTRIYLYGARFCRHNLILTSSSFFFSLSLCYNFITRGLRVHIYVLFIKQVFVAVNLLSLYKLAHRVAI